MWGNGNLFVTKVNECMKVIIQSQLIAVSKERGFIIWKIKEILFGGGWSKIAFIKFYLKDVWGREREKCMFKREHRLLQSGNRQASKVTCPRGEHGFEELAKISSFFPPSLSPFFSHTEIISLSYQEACKKVHGLLQNSPFRVQPWPSHCPSAGDCWSGISGQQFST